jgi:hypothetical protein
MADFAMMGGSKLLDGVSLFEMGRRRE